MKRKKRHLHTRRPLLTKVVRILDYEFESPVEINSVVIPAGRAAIYLIADRHPDGKYHALDVGESGDVETRLDRHDRRYCWERVKKGPLYAYLLYCPTNTGWTKDKRREVEKRIREHYNESIRCGDR